MTIKMTITWLNRSWLFSSLSMTFPAHTKRAHFELFGGDKIGSNHSSSFSTCLRSITPEVKRTFSSRDANLVLKIESKEDFNFSFLCGRNVSLHQMVNRSVIYFFLRQKSAIRCFKSDLWLFPDAHSRFQPFFFYFQNENRRRELYRIFYFD